MLLVVSAVLSITGTERSCREIRKGVLRVMVRWHIIAARLPPAEDPAVAILDVSMERVDWVSGEVSQRRASQLSWTAAGKGDSGDSLLVGWFQWLVVFRWE